MAIPVQILGQEIKEPFDFAGAQGLNVSALKELDKQYFSDYRWQVVRSATTHFPADRTPTRNSRPKRSAASRS